MKSLPRRPLFWRTFSATISLRARLRILTHKLRNMLKISVKESSRNFTRHHQWLKEKKTPKEMDITMNFIHFPSSSETLTKYLQIMLNCAPSYVIEWNINFNEISTVKKLILKVFCPFFLSCKYCFEWYCKKKK